MSISNAMQTGVSGLRANSTAVGRISDNIANANTDGYRRSFAQMVTTTTTSSGTGLAPAGVRAVQGTNVSLDGALRPTGRATDLAISGSGFFVVSRSPNELVESNYQLTRAGSFLPDENGFLRNAAGLFLSGYPYGEDGTLGAVDRNRFGDLESVRIGDVQMRGSPTTAITIGGNVPAQQTGLAAPGDPFLSSAEFFSPLGVSERLQFSWQPTAVANTWTVTVNDPAGVALGTVDVTFNAAGPNAGSPQTYVFTGFAGSDPATGQATVSVGVPAQTITLDFGAPDSFTGMTQFAGDYTPLSIGADGSETGMLVRTEIDERGDVYGVFDNGRRRALYNIPLAEVPNPDGLLTTDGNAFLLSRSSGPVRLSGASTGSAGTITAGALESSNVEVAQELTDLIQTQRAYSSNAKIVTTVDEMLDETMRLKR
ncbi:MAG TPA: flagellar hook protein FlgE [Paracoccaceae bacterium]